MQQQYQVFVYLPSGSTLMKRQYLKMLACKLASVPYFEWNYAGQDEENYLGRRMAESCRTSPHSNDYLST
jgi:hypothetical protein